MRNRRKSPVLKRVNRPDKTDKAAYAPPTMHTQAQAQNHNCRSSISRSLGKPYPYPYPHHHFACVAKRQSIQQDGKIAWVAVSSMLISPLGSNLPVAGTQAGECVWTVSAVLEIVDVHAWLAHVCFWEIVAGGWRAAAGCGETVHSRRGCSG